MSVTTKQIKELLFDKSNWKTVKFGDVAIQQKETVDRDNSDITKYIKGEHMKSEDLHLRSWGELSDEYLGPAFIRKFEKGDILYGSRRTYLRKVTIAPFDGITSNTTFVIKADEDMISNKLLPFIMLSESFSEHSIKYSKGSVNPYINWKDLTDYKFLLPPKDQQKKIAELLWAMDEVVEKKDMCLNMLIYYDLSYLNSIFDGKGNSNRVKLKNIISLKKGKKPNILNPSGDGLPYCTASYLRYGELESIVPKESWGKTVLIEDSDILLLWDGSNAGEVMRAKKGILASTMCKLYIQNEQFLDDYIFHFLRFKTKDIKRATVGSAIPHVDPGIIENIEIPKLNFNYQQIIVNNFQYIRKNIDLLKTNVMSSKTLQKSLLNQIF